jgi:hypothetical protein
VPVTSKFKRNYMISVTRLLVDHSYLADQMKGEMPEDVKRRLDKFLLD